MRRRMRSHADMKSSHLAFAISLVACPLLAQGGEEPKGEPVRVTDVTNTAVGLGGGAGGIFGARSPGPMRSRMLGEKGSASLERGIAWLRARQRESGAFGDDADDLRATSLVLLVMLADGSTMRSGPHKEPVKTAAKWLRAQLQADGTFGGEGRDESLETQALATAALVEAAGLSASKLLLGDAQRAVAAMAKPQDAELWQQADREPHAATWFVEACSSAAFFGLEVDRACADATTGRLRKLAAAKGAPAGAAEAALRCAWSLAQHDAPEHVEELSERIAAAPPRAAAPGFERWLDGSHALFQVGGRQWKTWRNAVLAEVLRAQADDGSWPAAKPKDGEAPRDWSPATCATARACLLLEVPFRFGRRVR